MAATHEVEIKFRIASIEDLNSKLKSAGFLLITPRTHEMNTAYDLSGRDLRARGCLLRLRQYGDKWTLTFKNKSSSNAKHKSRPEIETQIGNGPAMAQILEALGFQPVFSYEKFRSEWTDGQGHVVVDETPVGNFGEIEGEPGWIDRVAGQLGVSEREYIKASYSDLFQEWKRKTGSTASDMLFSK
ncbi:MAG TPA: class IV adenylate cyclase [Candidatus Acidoferrales bacterium]|nr:class IV adenylate cyclase [Candidatus Acidoferrales bacterium]